MHKAYELCNVSDRSMSAPVSSVGITGKKNQWGRLRRSWENYKITLEKVFREHLMHWRRHPEGNACLGTPPPLFLADHWGNFSFSLISFFFPFPLELMYATNYGAQKIYLLFHHPVWNYILMGDNPSIHDLLACQEILRTFFCIKCMNPPKNRRQQIFSLSLIL